MTSALLRGRLAGTWRAFRRDRRASSAVEFSIVALPFVFTLLMILQMSVYYMTQSALDAGVIQTADSLVNTFSSATSTVPTPSATSLRAQIAQGAGGMISAATVLVDLQPLRNLISAPVAIGSNSTPDIGTPRRPFSPLLPIPPVDLSLLALRAQANVTTFVPGLGAIMVVRSSTLLRRKGQ